MRLIVVINYVKNKRKTYSGAQNEMSGRVYRNHLFVFSEKCMLNKTLFKAVRKNHRQVLIKLEVFLGYHQTGSWLQNFFFGHSAITGHNIWQEHHPPRKQPSRTNPPDHWNAWYPVVAAWSGTPTPKRHADGPEVWRCSSLHCLRLWPQQTCGDIKDTSLPLV